MCSISSVNCVFEVKANNVQYCSNSSRTRERMTEGKTENSLLKECNLQLVFISSQLSRGINSHIYISDLGTG